MSFEHEPREIPIRPIHYTGVEFERVFGIDNGTRNRMADNWAARMQSLLGDNGLDQYADITYGTSGLPDPRKKTQEMQLAGLKNKLPEPNNVNQNVKSYLAFNILDRIIDRIHDLKHFPKKYEQMSKFINRWLNNASPYLKPKHEEQLRDLLTQNERIPEIRANIYADLGVYPSSPQYFLN